MEPAKSRGYWIRLLTEGCVIIVSILIAFVLDAWWNDREVRREIALDVANVKSELEHNRRLVQREIEILERIAAGGDEILEIMDASPDSNSVTVSDSLAWLVTIWTPTLDASFGAVDALISSGRLPRIDSPELRSGLAGLKSQHQEAFEDELGANRTLYETILPQIVDKLDYKPILKIEEEYGFTTNAKLEIPSFTSVEYPNRLAIRNGLRERTSYLRWAAAEMKSLLAYLDRLIDLTDTTVQ